MEFKKEHIIEIISSEVKDGNTIYSKNGEHYYYNSMFAAYEFYHLELNNIITLVWRTKDSSNLHGYEEYNLDISRTELFKKYKKLLRNIKIEQLLNEF